MYTNGFSISKPKTDTEFIEQFQATLPINANTLNKIFSDLNYNKDNLNNNMDIDCVSFNILSDCHLSANEASVLIKNCFETNNIMHSLVCALTFNSR